MGVPAFFRWLSRKYPSIVVHCDDGVKGQYHFDNLYLDMNGIIHPCSHPENKPPPENEEEMFLAIFEYVEDIMKIVKPKKLLYMAVDGVAPRAKMNQQRSRRFRAAQESYEKLIEVEKVKEELRNRGVEVKEKEKSAHFDSNVITPGTQFMINLSEALRTWINRKLSTEYKDVHEIWPKDLVVILSDASVPGEGEHKIMDYIRRQKSCENYDPNISHLLYGADADLIMLGLATHEPNFTILREEFKPNQPRPCALCGQLGHELKDCTGEEKPLEELPVPLPTEFIYIRLNVLREYLEKECKKIIVKGSPLDFERFIDDYVLLCFFVGNDFLPHLPSLEIRENAIDRLIKIYKYVLENFSDSEDIYLTKSGIVNKSRCQRVLYELGQYEDEIFKNRQQSELNFKERNKRRKLMQMNQELKWFKPETVSKNERPQVFHNAKDEASKVRQHYHNADNANQRLNSMLVPSHSSNSSQSVNPSPGGVKRKLEEDSDSEPEDLVQLYNEGWKERYYLHKFGAKTYDKISKMVADEYFKGLCWVLLYYYQGCPDWKWFFPYHYAPFASDFHDIEKIDVKFDGSAKPFHPLEQLMSVFPAASSENLPPTWRNLMTNIDSPIIDFYPISFKIDLNGKKAAWMGVALLPFIDEDRLFKALATVYDDLSEDEKTRNQRGAHLIFTSKVHSSLSKKIENINSSNNSEGEPIEDSNAPGPHLIMGTIKKNEFFSAAYQNVLCCEFTDPQYEEGFVFPAQLLKTAKLPAPVLKPEDLERFDRYRPVIGMNPRQSQAFLGAAGHRMVDRSVHKDYYSNEGRDRRERYDQRSHYQQHQQYQPRNGPRYDNGNRNYDRREQQYYQSRDQYYPQYQQSNYQSNYSSNSYYQQYSNSSHNQHHAPPPSGQYHNSYHSRSNYPNAPQQHRPANPNIPSYYTRDYVNQQRYQGPSRQQRR